MFHVCRPYNYWEGIWGYSQNYILYVCYAIRLCLSNDCIIITKCSIASILYYKKRVTATFLLLGLDRWGLTITPGLS